ncbi:MAG TPA: alpha/beta fold hydrolase [Acidobacteria bacterium]|nr:alpha/beta fold hydrolase [Acidobacteriota bacterium]
MKAAARLVVLLAVLAMALLPVLGEEEARAEGFRLTTTDGFEIVGDLYRGEANDAPLVVLLHMFRSDRKSWHMLVPELLNAGFNVLAIDQRGHGGSKMQNGEKVKAKLMPRSRTAEMTRQGAGDVEAAVAQLREEDGLAPSCVALVGASYGGTIAWLATSRLDGVCGVVLLSPGIDYFGVDITQEVRDYEGRARILVSARDRGSIGSARKIKEMLGKRALLTVYEEGGHGTKLLETHPDAVTSIVDFLKSAVRAGE